MTETKPVKIGVRGIVFKIISRLENSLDTSSTRATLANLRNSLGRDIETSVEIWPLIYEHMPEKFLSKSGNLTAEERAIITTLQLYAVHQQGQAITVNENERENYANIGNALKLLRTGDSSKAIDRRFNAMITASTYNELENHLRYLVKLVRSKGKGTIRINYSQLANDLFWYQLGKSQAIKLSWGRSYYSQVNSPKEETNHEQ